MKNKENTHMSHTYTLQLCYKNMALKNTTSQKYAFIPSKGREKRANSFPQTFEYMYAMQLLFMTQLYLPIYCNQSFTKWRGGDSMGEGGHKWRGTLD